MKKRRAVRGLRFALFGVLAAAVLSLAVMTLWNWLVPAIFGWKALSFGQALGLLVLSKILFGGFRGGHPGMHWRRRMSERWNSMTPEERAKFREGIRARCGPQTV